MTARLDWAGDRVHRVGAHWFRLDAWTAEKGLQLNYLTQGFTHVQTVHKGTTWRIGERRATGLRVASQRTA